MPTDNRPQRACSQNDDLYGNILLSDWPNAGHQAPLIAGATQERRLLAVACPGRAGGCPTGPPTDPYVRLSLIRFLGAARFHTARWPDDSDHPRHPSPPALRHDTYVAIRSCRSGMGLGLGVPCPCPAVVRRRRPASPSLHQVPWTEVVPWLPGLAASRVHVSPGWRGPAAFTCTCVVEDCETIATMLR